VAGRGLATEQLDKEDWGSVLLCLKLLVECLCLVQNYSEQKPYAKVSSDLLAGTLVHIVFLLKQHVCDLSVRLLE
jgi:hypothetical protein